ncbi:tissue inhibitor of metalloproteinase [Drosophila tropicalis]|uniref:tissue inhibitor of metalloproteinase n=1 Tax=Drosophila tropicalis TaxID=46794 RepID=UPI0035ABC70E
MGFIKYLSLLALSLLAIVAFYGQPANACSCMPSHPQTHFCTADFVVQLRVRRKSDMIERGKTHYKVQIRRTYKATPEALRMLRDGRLTAPSMESMCGISLDIGKVYIIAGRVPMLNICSYYKEYTKMTVTERHGFSGGYGKSCNCTVRPCFGNNCLRNREYVDGCKWSPFGNCERDFSACTPRTINTRHGSISRCRWQRTHAYKKCLSNP